MAKPTFRDIITSKSKDMDMSFRRGFDQFEPKNTPSDSTNTNSRYALWFIAVASIILLFFALSYFFAGATVTVTPKNNSVPLDGVVFTAIKSSSTDTLRFEVMTVKAEETKTVFSKEKKESSERASGQIIIYNNSGTSPQPLITGTRFETPEGKIFKIAAPVTVPGQKTQGGKLVPGSLEVTVYASEAGESYNIPLSDFTIPGFKGSPKYQTVYARSKTDMSGGTSGAMYVVNEADAVKARADLNTELNEKLLAQARAELPEGYVMFSGATFLKSSDATGPVYSDKEQVPVSATGTLSAIIFERESLERKIAKTTVRDFDNLPIFIKNIEELNLELKDRDLIDISTLTDISFTFSNTAEIIWKVDDAVLAQELAGKKKKEFDSILARYSMINKASVAVKPFWKNKIPDNIEKIKIHVLN